MSAKLTTEEFIKKARAVHGDRYDYSKVEYKGSRFKINIICREHGIFDQQADSHLQGHGCKECMVSSHVLTLSSFISKANKIHGNKYDYSKTRYISSKNIVEIVCKKHGSFYMTPNSHLSQKSGCKYCSGGVLSKETFIERANLIHHHVYDYSNVIFENMDTPIIILCNKHGGFFQRPRDHITGRGCQECGKEMRAKNLHNTKKYSVSKGSDGYKAINIPTDEVSKIISSKKKPNSVLGTRIKHHIYIMAKHLGRPIDTTKEEVHHKDGDRSNNKISNLELRQKGHGAGHTHKEKLESNAYYVLEHFDELPVKVRNKFKRLLGERV